MKAILIGDLHGCLDELKELLSILSDAEHIDLRYSGNNPKLVFVGDLGDRGVDSIGCVRLVKSLCETGRADCVAGNHDDKQVRYRTHEVQRALTGKDNPMRPMSPVDLAFQKELTNEEIDWLRKLPLTLNIHNDWFAIHAGVESRFDFEHQDPNQLLRCRYVDKDGKAKALNPDKTQPADTVYWTEAWDRQQNFVYGHNVHSLELPRIDKRADGSIKCIGIDTGAVFGGKLTAVILEWFHKDKDPIISFVQVRAHSEYAKRSYLYEE